MSIPEVSELEQLLTQLGWTMERCPYPEIAERNECELGGWSVIRGPVRIIADDAAELAQRVRVFEERAAATISAPSPPPTVREDSVETAKPLAFIEKSISVSPGQYPPELLGPIPIGFGDVTSAVPPPRRRRARRVDLPVHNEPRPMTRADCKDGPRPCPWVGCKYHLLIDVKEKGGMVVNFETGLRTLSTRRATDEEWMDSAVDRLDTMKHTCALDVADKGEHTLEEVGELYGITRERIRQIIDMGVDALREHSDKLR